jgi:inner membrane protein YidH
MADDPHADDARQPGPEPRSRQDIEASWRTHLANERTYLAWWRTGLAALAVGIAVGRVIPALAHRHTGALTGAVAICFAVLGIFLIIYGTYRERATRRALDRGDFSLPSPSLLMVLGIAGVVIGLLTIALIARGF